MVWTVNDLLDEHGNKLTYENFEIMFTFKPMFLQFCGLVLALKKWLQDIGINTVREKNIRLLNLLTFIFSSSWGHTFTIFTAVLDMTFPD